MSLPNQSSRLGEDRLGSLWLGASPIIHSSSFFLPVTCSIVIQMPVAILTPTITIPITQATYNLIAEGSDGIVPAEN